MMTRGYRHVLFIAGLMAAFAVTAAARGGGIEDGWRCANTPDNPRLAINYCVRAIYSGELSQDQLAATFYNRGFEYGKAGDYDLAIKDFQAAIDLRPGFGAASNSLAVAYMDKGEEAVAIEALGEAIGTSPNDALLYRNRAMLRLNRGEFSAALSDIEAAATAAPDDAENALWRFFLQHANGRIDTAGLARFAVNRDLNPWPGPAIAMFLGLIESQVIADYAYQAEEQGNWRLQCEALFYIGQFQLMRGARANAVEFLRAAVETGATGAMSYSGARSALARLGE